MAGHAQLKFVMTEFSKTQIHLTGLIFILISANALLNLHRLDVSTDFYPFLFAKTAEACIASKAFSCNWLILRYKIIIIQVLCLRITVCSWKLMCLDFKIELSNLISEINIVDIFLFDKKSIMS